MTFWESVVGGLDTFTYWETYAAALEYLALYIIPMMLFGLFLGREGSVAATAGCLSMILFPVIQAAAMAIFVLTLSPIILGLGTDALWEFPYQLFLNAPVVLLKYAGATIVASIIVAFIPLVGRLQSAHTLLIGGMGLILFVAIVDTAGHGTLLNDLNWWPGFWFVVGLLAISALISWIGILVAAGIAGAIDMVAEGLGTAFMMPIAGIFGFVPLFIYGAWLGSQLRGG